MSTFQPFHQIRYILILTMFKCTNLVFLFATTLDFGAMSLKFQLWRGRKWRMGRNREGGAIDLNRHFRPLCTRMSTAVQSH